MSAAHPISNLLHKTRGSIYIASQLLGQPRIPYWPTEKLNAVRDQRVRAVVGYATQHVPYYRDLFRSLALKPSDIQTAHDLAKLPLLDKQQIQEAPQRFMADTRAERTAFAMPTSGTSGMQLTIYQSQDYLLANTAWGERNLAVIQDVLGPGQRIRQMSVAYPNNSLNKVRAEVRHHAFVINRGARSIVSLFDPLETIIAEINRQRPNVLSAYGTFIELLFQTIKAKSIPMRLPKVVLYVSDHLNADVQQMIEEEFGVKVLSSYSAVEAFRIGFTCLEKSGFHLNSDLIHVRVVADDGRDLPIGQTGEIAISNLMNRGTVLLNYRLGDLGQLSDAHCPCGRTLPLLGKLEGRRDDVVRLPNGEYLHSATVWFALRENKEFLQYQLIQHELERFELKIVTVDHETFQRVSVDLCRRLQPVLGPSAHIETTFVNPYEPFGKRKRSQLVSLLNRVTPAQ
jgi:phenylacetate-CoA ligase